MSVIQFNRVKGNWTYQNTKNYVSKILINFMRPSDPICYQEMGHVLPQDFRFKLMVYILGE